MTSAIPLDSRQERIARALLSATGPVAAEALAADLHLTDRVVRYNLPSMEAFFAANGLTVLRRPGVGVWADGPDAARASVIALPHGTNEAHDAIRGTGLAVAQFPDGVAWGEEPARLVIGLAATGEDHIGMLSRLAGILEDEDLCGRLAVLRDPAEILAILTAEPDEDRDGGPIPPGLRRTTTITNPAGLHARPAAQVVAGPRGFEADVTIAAGPRHADARSITALLGLGASAGDAVTVVARGPDAEQALAVVMGVLESGRDK